MKARDRGQQMEDQALAFLNKQGFKLIERNASSRYGEIDLIVSDGQTLVFAEVRFRRNKTHGSGAETVTRSKQQRIIQTAQFWLQRQSRWQHYPARFDILSLSGEPVEIEWLTDAFQT